ncbi:MAG: polysaccharide biosynthesis protein [Clostridia bacterium]|nr:polysaccharide biosynthesis protein [Clostridia bacterium]
MIDGLIVLIAAFIGYWITGLGDNIAFDIGGEVVAWALCNILLTVGLLAAFGLYKMNFSSVGMPEALRVCACGFLVGIINFFLTFIAKLVNPTLFFDLRLDYSLMAVYALLLTCGIGVFRFSKRGYGALRRHLLLQLSDKKRVMIVGFNNDAFALIRNMTDDAEKGKTVQYKPICILDTDEQYVDKRIGDMRVVGTVEDAQLFVKRYNIEEIFITIPSTERAAQRKAIDCCKDCGCKIKLLPELNDLAHGELSVARLRPVDVADLLGREQKQVNIEEIIGYIENKVVLVTGGGGSIGSELSRQIASHNPKQLIILDIYENTAYDIEQELKTKYPNLNLLTLIASVRDSGKMRDVFKTYAPQIVFNAAAHKHVPLMETSPNEAVKNNVFGTLKVARAADEFGAETFVQISTDKAVNPTNIMGATKRICEMIIQTLGKHSKTKFVAVRFGNVLGSNGSVIPLFKKQIEKGGPVTVTHKDIIRYFMTIPEAVSLVLQAGAYAKNGQIFVLDMGEPVRIYDLAYNLIKLSGLEPDVDIKIECTGLRPGEKLFEERLMAEEGLQKTANGLISIAKPLDIDEENLFATLDELYKAAYEETDQMKEWVKCLVPTYTIDKRAEKTPVEREAATAVV